MVQLTSLAPDIVESILAGQADADISLRHCRKGIWIESVLAETLKGSIKGGFAQTKNFRTALLPTKLLNFL